MTTSNNLINFGDLSKAVETLIIKISEAVGVLYEPSRITRKAKAEAKAEEIMTLSAINIKDIQQRALERFVYEETKKQENIESIIENAIPLVKLSAEASKIENDWIVNFFENAKLISDSEMQMIWSSILAFETDVPGSFSKRTINLVSELDKKDALLFMNLCKFIFNINSKTCVIFDSDAFYGKYNLDFANLIHLDGIGLIQYSGFSFVETELPKDILIDYMGDKIQITFPNEKDNQLITGRVFLTQAGEELSSICNVTPESEILELTIQKWREDGLTVEQV